MLPCPDAEIMLLNAGSGRALAGDGPVPHQCWPSHRDRAGQRWRLLPVPGSRHTVRVEHLDTGLVLAVADAAEHNGAAVVLTGGRGDRHQCWRLVPLHPGEHALVNVASGKCLDLWDASGADRVRLAQFDFWNGPQQRWRLVPTTPRQHSRAVLTLVRDEPEFFPIWLRYYSRFFQPEDIYVLDHLATTPARPDPRFVRIPITHEVFSSDWHRDVVQRHQHELVERYDVVLCTDVDEIVAPDPRTGDLGTYIDTLTHDYVTCTGYEVLHLRDAEPPLDPARNVLDQRSTWFPNPLYSKPLLARVPMAWRGGFHERVDGAARHDPLLYLIHLHRVDYDICLKRHRRRVGFRCAQDDLDNSRGYQNRIVEPREFEHWFYRDRCNGDPVRPEPVPAHWRRVV